MDHEIGCRLRAARKRKGWSQEHLAAVAGVSTRQIQRIEGEQSAPTGETLQALASALGTDVTELRAGFTEDDLDTFRQEYFCPHCGSKLAERSPVHHEYGVDDVEVFECGFTRGMNSRPCPLEPRFPKFEDYELLFKQEGNRWWCHPIGQTEAARQVPLQIGCGTTQEEAEKWVKRSFICARDGYQAAQAFLPL
jgi:transcriptional regulator with XRE-family HTH domain